VADVAVGDAQLPGEPARAQGPRGRVLLPGVPELLDALPGGSRPGAQLAKLPGDLVQPGAELAGEPDGVEPLAGADLPGPVGPLHLGRQLLSAGRAAGDRGTLMGALGEVGLQPVELLGRRPAVAGRLAQRPHAW
jgi:hypothetical protein